MISVASDISAIKISWYISLQDLNNAFYKEKVLIFELQLLGFVSISFKFFEILMLTIGRPMLSCLEYLMSYMNSIVIAIDPLIKRSIYEFALDPFSQGQFFSFGVS